MRLRRVLPIVTLRGGQTFMSVVVIGEMQPRSVENGMISYKITLVIAFHNQPINMTFTHT